MNEYIYDRYVLDAGGGDPNKDEDDVDVNNEGPDPDDDDNPTGPPDFCCWACFRLPPLY
jgi:hypothetical protein